MKTASIDNEMTWQKLTGPYKSLAQEQPHLPLAILQAVDHQVEGRIFRYYKNAPCTAYLSMTLARTFAIYLSIKFLPLPLTCVAAAGGLVLFHDLNCGYGRVNTPAVERSKENHSKRLHAIALAYFLNASTAVTKGIWNEGLLNLGIAAAYLMSSGMIEAKHDKVVL